MFEMKMDMIHAQSYVSMPHPLYILLLYCLVTLQSQTSLCQDRFPGTTDNVDAFPCHCRTGSQCIQDRGMSSGDCECDDQFNPMPWSGPGCQIGNVARAKVATQSGSQSAYPAAKAVDGGINRDRDGGECSLAFPMTPPQDHAYWSVDLGLNYVIRKITIITEMNNMEESHELQVMFARSPDFNTEQTICSMEDSDASDEKISVRCGREIGRYVHISKREAGLPLNLCEVIVDGYFWHECMAYNNEFYYGPGCLVKCHCNQQCNSVDGHCPGNCTAGYRGDDCQQECPDDHWGYQCSTPCNCQSSCDLVSGICDGKCVAGYFGETCQEPCVNNTWGLECVHSCNCLHAGDSCGVTNGSCDVCAEWFIGIGCDYELLRWPSDAVPQIASVDGTAVNIRFQQWRPEFGGSGNVTSYIVEYRTLGNIDWLNLTTFHHIGGQQYMEAELSMPEQDVNYHIRLIPKEINVNYDGNGEPSKIAAVFTKKNSFTNEKIFFICMLVFGALVVLLLVAVVLLLIQNFRNKNEDYPDSESTVSESTVPEKSNFEDDDPQIEYENTGGPRLPDRNAQNPTDDDDDDARGEYCVPVMTPAPKPPKKKKDNKPPLPPRV